MDNFNSPISQTRLRQISNDACDSALATATAYNHAQTAAWNDSIINAVLKALVSESQTAAAETRYKFCVNSTIIQHLSDPRPSGTTSTASVGTSTETDTEKTAGDAAVEGEAEEELKKEVGGDGESEEVAAASSNKAASITGGPGRRGMHSASGAYWNNAKDGMWSHKYEGGEAKGMDIVIAIMWIAA
ncbi:hypothetical protein KC345_g3086 [Hortaea werneckii]|nr:hypothetical protein KC345_g3086 [Hortaea werneckii]